MTTSGDPDNLQPTIEGSEKEDRPLKRKVDRQAQKINELTARISKLETEAEEHAEKLGSIEDQWDDAQGEIKKAFGERYEALRERHEAVKSLKYWMQYADHLEGKDTEIDQLNEALAGSQKEVAQLKETCMILRKMMRSDFEVYGEAFSTLCYARRSEDAAFASLQRIFPDRKISSDNPGSNSPNPPQPRSEPNQTRLQYTIEEMKRLNHVPKDRQTSKAKLSAAIARAATFNMLIEQTRAPASGIKQRPNPR
ncbi:MAG: hypothetical protein LQ338_004394 [Usnochroma carphineum]|nr:MAG: hypothetical protein LQ338_004394 [Usnochroma carphineum]